MNFTEFNLKQLLELGLRCPEVGAVNFNIIYLILKTIIKRQGFENLTPEFTFAYYGSQEDVEEETESSDEFDELPEQYSQRLSGVSEDLLKLKETIQQLSKRISDLEARPVQPEEIETESNLEIEISDEDEESSEESTEEIQKDDTKEEPEIAESEEAEKPKMKKGNDILRTLRSDDSEGFIVDKFEALLQDFDTVMNGYTKLGMQVEELDKIANKKVSMEDDLERLKEKVDRLETYVYTGQHTEEDVGLEEKDHEDFEYAKAEAPQKEVDQVKASLAKIVRDLMAMPVERRAEILEQKSETDVKKIRPSMKKAYEKFIEAANQVRGAKEAELKDMISAGQISVGSLQHEPEVSSEELMLKGDKKHLKTAKERLKTAVQTINIIKAMGNTEHEARVVRVQRRKASRSVQDSEDTDEEQLSSEEEESSSSYEDDISKKAGFRPVDRRALKEFKKSILNYVKTHTEEMLTTFMEKIKMVKTSIANVQKENEQLKIDVQYVMDRLIILETNQNKLQQRILVLEEKERANFLELENIIIELDKKAERSDSTLENKKFLNALQEEMVVLNETTSANLESMKNFFKNFASKLQEDLDQKISGFEMDIRLEPLAGRLKKQEKLLKEIFLKIRVLECQSMGPIEVKRYVHCEDGKRVKPLQKMMTEWNQSELSFFGNDKLLEENIADQIEADVEKRLEEAIFRDSKYYIKGFNLQAKATKT